VCTNWSVNLNVVYSDEMCVWLSNDNIVCVIIGMWLDIERYDGVDR